MKIALFGKNIREGYETHLANLLRKLSENNCELIVYGPFLKSIQRIQGFESFDRVFEDHSQLRHNADMLFSIGGDGTLLDTVSLVRDSGIPVLGINLGRLGFLSSISREDIIPSVEKVLNGAFSLDQRTLLKLDSRSGLFGDFPFALNDLTVSRKDSTALIVVHVYVDDLFLNSYWTDGLIVATPTRSTAYSMSSGAPIVSPGSENFVITAIAPHTLTIRPLVVSDKSAIRLRVDGRDKMFMASIDSKVDTITAEDEMIVRCADFKFNLVKVEDKDFYTTIREKLKWGLDARN